ncbi:MAG: hypothetical protein M3N82_01925 [Pseudomonadota bacterium]|nr:hypothetical protein [Pseudomonadota bacterium]
MCSNYTPVTRVDRLMTFFGVEYQPKEELQREVFPLETAPFKRLSVEGQEGGSPALVAEEGMFGLPATTRLGQLLRRRSLVRSSVTRRRGTATVQTSGLTKIANLR